MGFAGGEEPINVTWMLSNHIITKPEEPNSAQKRLEKAGVSAQRVLERSSSYEHQQLPRHGDGLVHKLNLNWWPRGAWFRVQLTFPPY